MSKLASQDFYLNALWLFHPKDKELGNNAD